MIVIPPIEVTNARLTDSNVLEDDHPEYSDLTTYAVGDRVIVLTGDGTNYNNVYESVIADNLGNDPWLDNVDSPTNWLLIGKINRWKMFELSRNTTTVNDTSIEVEVTPNTRINTVALFGLQAESVQCIMTVSGDEVYNETIMLTVRNVATWLEYFFEPFIFQKAAFFENLPPFTQGVVTIIISRASGEVKCAGCVLGSSVYLGSAEARAESDALNFSTVDRNEFGDTLLVPRRTIPKTVQRVFTDKARVNRLLQVREDLNAQVAVWSALDDPTNGYFNAGFILGFYRVFRIGLDHPENAVLTLELEEV